MKDLTHILGIVTVYALLLMYRRHKFNHSLYKDHKAVVISELQCYPFLQGGILTGAVVLLSLAFLMPYCAFIPRTTLASVIICAVIFSIEYHVVIPIWKSKSKKQKNDQELNNTAEIEPKPREIGLLSQIMRK